MSDVHDAIGKLLKYVTHDVTQLVQETVSMVEPPSQATEAESVYSILAYSAEMLSKKHADDSFYENMVRNSAQAIVMALASYAGREDS